MEQFKIQRDEINRLSLQLRNAYHESETETADCFTIPLGGSMTESIGAWPEFILRGTFCKRSYMGLCSPCFYSRSPISFQSRSAYLDMISRQISYIIDNFGKLVIERQYGKVFENSQVVSLVLTPTGSFFDDYEFPIEIRLDMERRLVKIAEELHIDIQLHIESHCEDFIQYSLSDKISCDEIALLKKLNTKVVFGFESKNEYARNVLYNKHLALSDFETATEKLRSLGLTPGAFVFAGLFAFNDLQTRNDVLNTVSYLLRRRVFPVLMFQNVQPYTITDVLLKQGKIKLLEPLTVAWIIEDVLALLQKQPSYWLIADPVGGPPEPESHIFRKPIYTCNNCSDIIYKALVELRTTRLFDQFLATFATLKKCNCYVKYNAYIRSLSDDCDTAQSAADNLLYMCQCETQAYLALYGGKNEVDRNR